MRLLTPLLLLALTTASALPTPAISPGSEPTLALLFEDEIPPPTPKSNVATTDEYTPENGLWFHDLIVANPDAEIVIEGPGITVTSPPGEYLTLPSGPIPRGVMVLNTNPPPG